MWFVYYPIPSFLLKGTPFKETVINLFSESISEGLKKGCYIEIRGLGRWYLRELKENFKARNPATNELIYKPKRVKIRFRPSKKLKKIINEWWN